MKKTEKNLYLLYMIFAIGLITANCIGAKVFNTGLTLFGNPITLTVGVIAYPITFLCTDIISEIWGKKEASLAVKYGFICQVISTVLIVAARYFPAVDPATQDAYVKIMGQNYMFVAASLVAYYCSQSWDVFIFHKIRDKYLKKHKSVTKGKWIWNNASTMSSQLIDSILYATVAFGIGFKWLWTDGMQIALINMIMGQWLFKVVFAALDTPIFYLCTRKRSE